MKTRPAHDAPIERAWTKSKNSLADFTERQAMGLTVSEAGQKIADSGTGTSIFDPVLCELAYRWFCPPGGLILDPFAGGSVRGIVAAKLGRRYVGVDLREEQIVANRQQWAAMQNRQIEAVDALPIVPDCLPDITPIERAGSIWIKRDDAFCIGGGRGGKVRTCWSLAQGAPGLVTAGSRASPQVNIVAQIARKLGIPCRVHTPEGELSPEVRMAQAAGAEVVQHKAGYNNVIVARARDDAKAQGWVNIPFGMECKEAVLRTADQVRDLPDGVKRIVMPVGSGMSLAGVLRGLKNAGKEIPVVGVVVGADPTKRLDQYAPGWRTQATLVPSGLPYERPAPKQDWEGVALDPIYESKCLPFLQPDDLFWIVGLRASVAASEASADDPVWLTGDSRQIATHVGKDFPGADFLFSCPPYADLEVYSDNPADLSTLGYNEFRRDYTAIIAESCKLLKPDRFACFVVGEVRDKKGNYYGFVPDTIKAFTDCGLKFYNEAILVTAVGSLPIRVGRQFESGRKLGKTHQNVLVFIKGDAKKATADIGVVEFGDITPTVTLQNKRPKQAMTGDQPEQRECSAHPDAPTIGGIK